MGSDPRGLRMSVQLDALIKQADALPLQDQLRLAALVLEHASRKLVTRAPRRKWNEIRGIVPYPLADRDAQTWVSRTRRESDEHRNLPR